MPHDDITPSELIEIAARIRLIADGYESLAAELVNSGVEIFEASGISTLKDATISRLEGTLDRNWGRIRKQQRLAGSKLASRIAEEINKRSPSSLASAADIPETDPIELAPTPVGRKPAKRAALTAAEVRAMTEATIKQQRKTKRG